MAQRPAAITQQDMVRNLTRAASTDDKAGALWYLIVQRWYGDWSTVTSTGTDADDLGPIGNEELLGDGGTLKRGLVEGQDYVLVPQTVWHKLVEWYGGGPEVARPLIEAGFLKRRLVVEVYPMTVRVVERRNASGRQAAVEISKAATGLALLTRVCTGWYMAPHRCQLWRLGAEGYEVVGAHALLQHSGVDEDTQLVLEERLPDGDFEAAPPLWVRPRATPGAFMASAGPLRFAGAPGGSFFAPAHDSTTAAPLPGITGLVNVGNTCFMNSSLQCVSAVRPLREFLTDEAKWKPLVNSNNPLGTQGRIVTATAELLGRMWAPDNVSHVVPRQLKKVISDWAPQFEGYRQHDAQEFVAFLLDGLHEDLNRRAPPPKKGSVAPALPSTSETAMAAAAWDAHLQRNRSEIVTLFHGQLRSRLECPHCKGTSVAFDAMSVLSLPLPRVNTRVIALCFVAAAAAVAQELDVTVHRAGTVRDLKDAVRAAVGRPVHLVVGEVYQRVLHKEYADTAEVALINPGDAIFAFEVDVDPARDDAVMCQFVFRNGRTGVLSSDWPLVATFTARNASARAAAVRTLAADAVRRGTGNAARAPLVIPRLTGKSGKTCGAACGNDDCRGCAVDEAKLAPGDGAGKSRVNVALDQDDGAWELTMARAGKERAAAALPEDKATVTLDSCLRRFLEPETLSAHDAWYCPTCRDHVQAQKQISLWKLPPVLVVHLKRFAQLSTRYREKLEDLVVYPTLGLDLSEFVPDQRHSVYDLVAVSNHMGGLSGGHYIAHTRHAETGDWWQYNDEHCTRLGGEDGVVSRSAYLLFYVLRKTTTT